MKNNSKSELLWTNIIGGSLLYVLAAVIIIADQDSLSLILAGLGVTIGLATHIFWCKF